MQAVEYAEAADEEDMMDPTLVLDIPPEALNAVQLSQTAAADMAVPAPHICAAHVSHAALKLSQVHTDTSQVTDLVSDHPQHAVAPTQQAAVGASDLMLPPQGTRQVQVVGVQAAQGRSHSSKHAEQPDSAGIPVDQAMQSASNLVGHIVQAEQADNMDVGGLQSAVLAVPVEAFCEGSNQDCTAPASTEPEGTPAEHNANAEEQVNLGGQVQAVEGQGIAPDGQHPIATGQTSMPKGHSTIPAEQETVSEACCVCQSAEDGEIMLLCDKCNEPAHLGCVGFETVPDGDWFCPTCTKVLVGSEPNRAGCGRDRLHGSGHFAYRLAPNPP